jgi:hypothetical protein
MNIIQYEKILITAVATNPIFTTSVSNLYVCDETNNLTAFFSQNVCDNILHIDPVNCSIYNQ